MSKPGIPPRSPRHQKTYESSSPPARSRARADGLSLPDASPHQNENVAPAYVQTGARGSSQSDIQQRALPRQLHRLRNHLDEGHRQHVPRAQRQKILQKFPRPLLMNNKISTHQIPRRRNEPEPRRQPRPKCQIMSHLECGGLPPLFRPAVNRTLRRYNKIPRRARFFPTLRFTKSACLPKDSSVRNLRVLSVSALFFLSLLRKLTTDH